jgi:hypothetical protein
MVEPAESMTTKEVAASKVYHHLRSLVLAFWLKVALGEAPDRYRLTMTISRTF